MNQHLCNLVDVFVHLRPSIDGIEEIILLRGHPQSLHTVHSPIDYGHIGTCKVLSYEKITVIKLVSQWKDKQRAY